MDSLKRFIFGVVLAVAALVSLGPSAFAEPPVVPAVPTDAVPVWTLTQTLAPVTAIAPNLIAALATVMAIASIFWAVNFAWRQAKRRLG